MDCLHRLLDHPPLHYPMPHPPLPRLSLRLTVQKSNPLEPHLWFLPRLSPKSLEKIHARPFLKTGSQPFIFQTILCKKWEIFQRR